MPARGSITQLQIHNRASVPADASAVVLNVTVTQPERAGFVTVYPCGTDVPTASNINFLAGSTVANLVVSKIGADGTVCIFNSSAAHLVADVDGYFPAVTSYQPARPGPSARHPVRLPDHRRPVLRRRDPAGKHGHRADRRQPWRSTRRGIDRDVERDGHRWHAVGLPDRVPVWHCSAARLESQLHPGTTAAVAVIAKVGVDGKVCILNSGATQVVVDVNGYFMN